MGGNRMKPDRIADGFRGQVLHSAPANLRLELARHPLGSELHALDLGWFPRAFKHFRERPQGAEEHILIYCSSGGGWFEIDRQRQALSRGQVLLVPRGKPHRYGANEARPWSIYWAHFGGYDAAAYFSRLLPLRYTIPVSPETGRQIERLSCECYQVLGTGHTLRSFLLVAHILRHLFGVLLLGRDALDGNAAKVTQHDFVESIDFMHANLSRSLSLTELAHHAGLSASRYSALFKAKTGTAPVQHHIDLRVQAACRLLSTTAMSVKEICNCLGYNDPLYFSRLFKKIMGSSPSTYRRDAKG
jgi:AraC family transcriptional regulator, arabinose operon regulatory protein